MNNYLSSCLFSVNDIFFKEDYFLKNFLPLFEAQFGFKIQKEYFITTLKQSFFHELRSFERRAEEKDFIIKEDINSLRDIDNFKNRNLYRVNFVSGNKEDISYVFGNYFFKDNHYYDFLTIDGEGLVSLFSENLFREIKEEQLTKREFNNLPLIYSFFILKHLLKENHYGFFGFFADNFLNKEHGFYFDNNTYFSTDWNLRNNGTVRNLEKYRDYMNFLDDETKEEIYLKFKNTIEEYFNDNTHLKVNVLKSLEDVYSSLKS